MKRIFCFGIFSLAVICFAEEFITVYKDGNDFFVRSNYSDNEDMIIHNFRYINEKSHLIKRTAPFAAWQKSTALHYSNDDYPAVVPLGKYGTLSGNHGSPYTRCLTVPGHGLTANDRGGVITEKNRKNTYVILQILDKDNLLIHPEGLQNTVSPRFPKHTTAPLFYKGKQLRFTKSVMKQLYPLNRITDWQLLADGKTPVPEKKEIKCRFVDFVFVHDLLDPYHVIQAVKKAPDDKYMPEWNARHSMCFVNTPELRKKYASYAKLPALVTYANKVRFQPRCARVNYRKITYHAPLSHANNLDIMFYWGGLIARQKRQLFYIPKLKPLTVTDRKTKEKRTIDLTAGVQIPIKMEYSYYIPLSDVIDRKDLPDRFIRITGDEKQYRYGIALGYSMIMGKTAKENMPGDRTTVYHLYKSHKIYPFSGCPKNIKPGKVEEVVAYTQYFDPRREPDATSFYCHYQGDSLMVYLDFHKELKNKTIKLPKAAVGRKITVFEKTPALELHTKGKVSASGITLSNKAKHGYLVLKLDK